MSFELFLMVIELILMPLAVIVASLIAGLFGNKISKNVTKSVSKSKSYASSESTVHIAINKDFDKIKDSPAVINWKKPFEGNDFITNKDLDNIKDRPAVINWKKPFEGNDFILIGPKFMANGEKPVKLIIENSDKVLLRAKNIKDQHIFKIRTGIIREYYRDYNLKIPRAIQNIPGVEMRLSKPDDLMSRMVEMIDKETQSKHIRTFTDLAIEIFLIDQEIKIEMFNTTEYDIEIPPFKTVIYSNIKNNLTERERSMKRIYMLDEHDLDDDDKYYVK